MYLIQALEGRNLNKTSNFGWKIWCHLGWVNDTTFWVKMAFWPKKCIKIGFKLDKMCHMGAHTFILYSNFKIYPKSILMRHTWCADMWHTLYWNLSTRPLKIHLFFHLDACGTVPNVRTYFWLSQRMYMIPIGTIMRHAWFAHIGTPRIAPWV